MNLSLPLFLNRENRLQAGVILFLTAAALYLLPNHLHLFQPLYLPLTWIDRAVPFLPGTVWIYISEYAFFPLIYFTCQDITNQNKYIYSFFALQAVSILIFWVWPTTYPREAFPLPDTLDAITHFTFATLRQTDSPANCCPSLHVSGVYLSVFIFLDERREQLPFYFLWGTLIALSTLTTKQHYVVDVIAGFLLAVTFYWVFHRMMDYRPWTPAPISFNRASRSGRT